MNLYLLKTIIDKENFYILAKQHHNLDLQPKKKKETSLGWSINDLNDLADETSFIIEPFCKKGEIIIATANPKVGKSFFAMDISLMLAGGEPIGNRLQATKPFKVLYVDTEMQEIESKIRIKKLLSNYPDTKQIEKNFKYISVLSDRDKIDLSTKKDQQWFDNITQNIDFIVLDNLGGILPYGAEKSESIWETTFHYLKSLASREITVFIVHHLNKGGEHRGTGKIIDDVDLALLLKKPEDCPIDKTRIEINFSHSRHLYGDQLLSFTLEYCGDKENIMRRIVASNAEPEHDKAFVLEEEISQHDLSEIQQEMLNKVRDSNVKTISAKMFVNESEKGRSKSSVTNAFNDLCLKGLLAKSGSGSGTRYFRPTSTEELLAQ